VQNSNLSWSNIEKIEKELVNFSCQKHKRKNITYFCTDANCDNRILCSDCLLTDHLLHIQSKKVRDITDFIEENKFLLDPQRKINDASKEVDQAIRKTKNYIDDKLEKLKNVLLELISKMKKNADIKLDEAREEEQSKLRKIQEKLLIGNDGCTSPRKVSTVFDLKVFLENLYKKRTILEEHSIFERFEKFYRDLQTSQEYIRNSFTMKLEALVKELQQSLETERVVAVNPSKLGILQNVSINELKQFGWTCVFEQPYEYKIPFEEIQTIRENAGQHAKVLLGAIESKNPDNLVLCCIANCKKALLESTSCDKGTGIDGAFWYNVRGKSIGFSDVQEVKLNKADAMEGDLKLSWHYNNAGYRVGKIKNFGKEWKRIILLHDWV